jgi:hypothetical protein
MTVVWASAEHRVLLICSTKDNREHGICLNDVHGYRVTRLCSRRDHVSSRNGRHVQRLSIAQRL